jgi:hypothetical protein
MTNDGWEIIEKQRFISHKLPKNSASVRKKCINVSEDLRGLFKGYSGVELFINKPKKQIGLKPSNEKTAFKWKNGIVSISFLERHVTQIGVFKATWNGEMIVIHLLLPSKMDDIIIK